MSCKSDVKQAILDKALDELVDRRNTFTRLSMDTIQVNGIADNSKSKAQSRVQARAIAKELLKRTAESFNGHVTGYITETSEFDPILVTFRPTDKYIDYEYNRLPDTMKDGETTESDEQIERDQVLSNTGINTQSQLKLFDPNTSNGPEQGVFARFVGSKQAHMNYLYSKLKKIQAQKKERGITQEDLVKLNKQEGDTKLAMYGNEELGIKGLKQEITDLRSVANAQVQSVGYYIEKDLQRLNSLAVSNNIDDVREAQRLIDFYKLAGTFEDDDNNPFFTREDVFIKDENGNLTTDYLLDQSVINQYKEWMNTAVGMQAKVNGRQKEILVDQVNLNPLVKNTYGDKSFNFDELMHTEKGLGDTDFISMWTMDITHGLASTNGTIPQVMFSALSTMSEVKSAWSRGLAEDVDKMLPKVTKELTRLGKTFESLGITGLKGNSYNIFKQISKEGNETHNLVQRHTKEYEDEFSKAIDSFDRAIDSSRNIIDYNQKQRAINTAFEKLKKWKRENTIMLDGSRMEDASYKKNLVDLLGEKGYAEEVQRQKDLMTKYEADREYAIGQSLILENKDTFDELSDKGKNNIARWENRNSPKKGFEDYNSVKGIFFDNSKDNNYMIYNVLIPRKYKAQITSNISADRYSFDDTDQKTGHYDRNYEAIHQSPDLAEFYDKVKEFCEVVHESMSPELQEQMAVYTLPGLFKTSSELISDKNIGLLSGLIESFKQLMDRIRTGFGVVKQAEVSYATNDPITGRTNYKVNDNFLRGNARALSERRLIESTKFLQAFNSSLPVDQRIKEIKNFSVLELSRFNPSALLELANYLHVDLSVADAQAGRIQAITNRVGKVVEIGRLISDFSLHSVVQSQSFDLPKLMKYFSDASMAYAARNEALPILEIMRKYYDAIQNPNTTNVAKRIFGIKTGKYQMAGIRTNASRQMDNWFNREVLDNYGPKHAGVFGSKTPVSQSRIAEIDRQVAKLEAQINIAKDKDKVNSLTRQRDRLLSEKTIKPFDEDIYTSEEREKVGQLQHLIDSEEDDNKRAQLVKIQQGLGRTRTATAFIDNMLNWVRTLRLGYNLSSALTNFLEGVTSNMILGASNEYFEPRELLYGYNIVKESWLKNATFGYLETKRARKNRALVDKFNVIIDSKNELQRASSGSLGDKLNFLNPYGVNSRVEYINQSPLMVAILRTMKLKDKDDNESSIWDAYDNDGHLLDNFKTEENLQNWEHLDGEQYEIFRHKLEDVIVLGHGNYAKMRGMMIKSNAVGKAGMMFKTWMPEAFYWRFGKEQDNIRLGKQGVKGRYWSYTPGAAAVHGAAIGATLFGPIGAAIGAGLGLGAGLIAGTRADSTMIGLIKETILTTKQLFLKSLGMPINLLTGREIVGTGQKAFENWVGKGKFTAQDAKNMKANMADLAMQLAWLGLILGVKAALWNDDDKPDDPERQAHNILVNRLMNLSSQAAMYTNPVDTWKSTIGSMAVVQYCTDVGKEIDRAQKALNGDDIISSGTNAGKSGLLIQTKKIALPGMFKDTKLGFGNQADKVSPQESPWHQYFHSDAYIDKQQVKGDRAERRLELMGSDEYKSIEDIDERKKEVNKQINKEFPSQKALEKLGETRKEYEDGLVK